jgi:nucleotide-binding universal stress UspA family protein
MPTRPDFRILAAVDGSAHSRAALTTLLDGPWPAGTRVRAVVARAVSRGRHAIPLFSADAIDDTVDDAQRALATRWPDAEVVLSAKTPAEAILSEAQKFRADVIVIGWRGHGPARRLLMGSVSRDVVRRATCGVLVVRRPTRIRHVVVALDGSPNATRALRLIAALPPPRDGRVTLVQVVEVMAERGRGPSVAGIRATVSEVVRQMNADRVERARKTLDHASVQLRRAGWGTRTEQRTGEPLRGLLDSVIAAQADLVVVGARGTSGVRQLLLGSVAEGMLLRSPVPVLIVR